MLDLLSIVQGSRLLTGHPRSFSNNLALCGEATSHVNSALGKQVPSATAMSVIPLLRLGFTYT